MHRRRPQDEKERFISGHGELKPGETVVFSWIVFKSRAHRDKINAKVMKDPRLAKMMDLKAIPFDSTRMVYGAFKVMAGL